MLLDLVNFYNEQLSSLLIIIQIIVNIIFASAVAKDAGDFAKLGQKTLLVSGIVWAFATLVGGVFVAVAYWFIHHSTLTRSSAKQVEKIQNPVRSYEK